MVKIFFQKFVKFCNCVIDAALVSNTDPGFVTNLYLFHSGQFVYLQVSFFDGKKTDFDIAMSGSCTGSCYQIYSPVSKIDE
jgi:hypothetical protein